jgi:hypothetical protein
MSNATMYKLLRFDGSLPHDPAVDAWFAERAPALVSLTRPWYERLRACGADVRECIHDGCPVVCVEDAPFAYVNIFTAHAAVGFFHGASLADPARMLQGTGKYMRHIKLRPDTSIDRVALEQLVALAYRDIQTRLAAERSREASL